MSLVSVLIPTYKPGSYLINCLKSLDRQSLKYSDFCVYICVNGSGLDSRDFVLSLLKRSSFNYKLFYTEQAGVSNARNLLIKSSTEPFLVFLDDDDYVSDDYLLSLLEVTNDKVMGVSDIRNFDSNGAFLGKNYISKCFDAISEIEFSKFKSRKFYSSPVAKMLSRSMVDEIFFDTKVLKGEDSLFMALLSKNILAVRKVEMESYYFVYERAGSVTRSKYNLRKDLKELLYLFLNYFKLLLSRDYNKVFIMTRLAATIFKIFKLIKRWVLCH
ncbi:glycosyltransferase family 2 protein [Marinomonas sp. FW-1]|uniref:glycosyltransferase family 2 protein n=1 Tax=Marinomonas sp. FW-1 TaxID=2071621 RepID=UPI0010BFD6CF|nr:glycosyltransferase family 2 protein [Marinomonas sp. FW-1]